MSFKCTSRGQELLSIDFDSILRAGKTCELETVRIVF